MLSRAVSTVCRAVPARKPFVFQSSVARWFRSTAWMCSDDSPRVLGTRYVDVRSDTVTKPTAQMSLAMMDAQVGDDVFGEDATVNALQRKAAEMFGKEAALFVPSGTMGNLISVAVHCGRGDEVILGTESHIFNYEQGGCSALMGVPFNPVVNNKDGTLPIEAIEAAVKADNVHYPRTKLVALENTQNRCGGRVLTPDYCARVAEVCKKHGLALHLDGARIMNASVALGVPPDILTESFDSVSVCLSKGLGAPIGSVIVGTEEFIYKARRLRKVLGGGMRQAGVIAAAGIIAFEHQVKKLAQDHANAKAIARGLSRIPGVSIEGGLAAVETNIMFVNIAPEYGDGAGKILPERLLNEHRVRVNAYGTRRLRIVTHHQVLPEDVETIVGGFSDVLMSLKA